MYIFVYIYVGALDLLAGCVCVCACLGAVQMRAGESGKERERERVGAGGGRTEGKELFPFDRSAFRSAALLSNQAAQAARQAAQAGKEGKRTVPLRRFGQGNGGRLIGWGSLGSTGIGYRCWYSFIHSHCRVRTSHPSHLKLQQQPNVRS